MRKGFILTLTTVALTLMVASAVAFGPTVENVPDVWITDQGDTDNVFRFSDALVLDDYIIPGVSGGEGSTSDSLYWHYALRDVVVSGTDLVGTGAYLSPVDQHYQINAFGAETPTETEGTAAWKDEVNGWTLQSIADAGALDFYNIRLNLDAANPVPAADPVSGVPDYQEASLYVTDGATTPSVDRIIIATVDDNTTPDRLSQAGTPCSQVADYDGMLSDANDPWGWFALLVNWMDDPLLDPVAFSAGPNGMSPINQVDEDFDEVAIIINDLATNPNEIEITTEIDQPILRFGRAPGLLLLVSPGTVDLTQGEDSSGNKRKAYRLKATMGSDNVDAVENTLTLLTLNGRNSIGASFGGYRQAGPSQGNDICATTYLVPTASGSVLPAIMVFDDANDEGGVITASSIRVDSFVLTTMLDGVERASSGVGAADHTVAAAPAVGSWTGIALDDASIDMVISPETPQTASVLSIAGTSSGVAASPNASAFFGFDNQFTTTADTIVVVKALINTTASDTEMIPTLRLTMLQLLDTVTPNYKSFMINDFMLDRTLGFNGASDISNSIDDYYVIGEAAGALPLNTLWFAGLVNQTGLTWTGGNLQLHELTVTEFGIPLCPCD